MNHPYWIIIYTYRPIVAIDYSGPMATARVHIPTAYSVVLKHLQREIRLGRLTPGQRLPPEREYAEQLGVSRVTLREALRVLEGEGVIEVKRGPGGGAFVKRPELGAHYRPSLNHQEALALQEFRMAVEPLAARRAATRISAEAVAALQADLDRLAEVEDVGEFRSIDSRFHLTLAEWADCRPLLEAVESARIAMFDTLDGLDFDLVVPSTHDGHQTILRAIAEADPGGAEDAMRDHIQTATDEIDAFYASLN